MKKLFLSAAAILTLLLTALTGCAGEALPAGVEEKALTDAGLAVVLQITSGEYESIYRSFRTDVKETVSTEQIRALILKELDGAGAFKQVEDSMTTGQTVGSEKVAVAAFFCEFEEDDVLIRVSFDKDLQLVGLSLQQQ